MSAEGESHRIAQTPGDAIADAQAFIEQGLLALEVYLARWADFQLYLERKEEVTDEHLFE